MHYIVSSLFSQKSKKYCGYFKSNVITFHLVDFKNIFLSILKAVERFDERAVKIKEK